MCFHYYLQSYWFLNVCGCCFDGAYYVLSLLFTKLLVSKCLCKISKSIPTGLASENIVLLNYVSLT